MYLSSEISNHAIVQLWISHAKATSTGDTFKEGIGHSETLRGGAVQKCFFKGLLFGVLIQLCNFGLFFMQLCFKSIFFRC